jgi:hypothetical protein
MVLTLAIPMRHFFRLHDFITAAPPRPRREDLLATV